MNKYLHTTVNRSQRILRSVALPDSADGCDRVLLFYTNHVQLCKVEYESHGVVISLEKNFEVANRIRWADIIGNHLVVITNDGYLTVMNEEFVSELCAPIREGLSPSQIPIAHIAPSFSKETMLCCGFTENMVFCEFREGEPKWNLFKLNLEGNEEFVCLAVCGTDDPNVYCILAANAKSHEKKLFHVNISLERFEVSAVFDVPADAIGLLPNAMVYTSHAILSNGGGSLELAAPINLVSEFPNCLILQLVDKTIWAFDPAEMKLVPMGSYHLLAEMRWLSASHALCVPTQRSPFIVELPSNIAPISFGELNMRVMDRTSIITNAALLNRTLVIGSSDERICMMENVIPMSGVLCEEPTANLKKCIEIAEPSEYVNEKYRLFSMADDNLVISTDTKTFVLNGSDLNVSDNSTIITGQFGSDIVQIHTTGICTLSGYNWDAPAPIVAATLSPEYCVIAMENNMCMLLREGFEVVVQREIGRIIDMALCADFLVIATEQNDGENSAVTLYTLNLLPTDGEIQLPSLVCSMVAVQGEPLFLVSTADGNGDKDPMSSSIPKNVLMFSIDEATCAMKSGVIYQSTKPVTLIPFGEYPLIIGDRSFLVSRSGLQPINLHNPLSIGSCGSRSLWTLVDSGDILLHTVEDFSDMTISYQSVSGIPRKILGFDNAVYTICRCSTKDGFESSIDILWDGNREWENLPSEYGGIISALPLSETELVVGFTTKDERAPGAIGFISVGEDKSMTLRRVHKLRDGPPHAMALWSTDANTYVFFSMGRQLQIMKHNNETGALEMQKEPGAGKLASIHSQIAFIECRGKFLWVGDRTQSVICFIVDINHKERPDGEKVEQISVSPVAVDTKPRQLTAMKCIDDHTVAVGDRYGNITILRLPDDIIGGTPWRMSMPRKRGVFMPPRVGHLIRVASFSTGECITSIISNNNGILYTTLFGMIGALVPMETDEDYFKLTAVEARIVNQLSKQYGFMSNRGFEHGKISVVNGDLLRAIGELSLENIRKIEVSTKFSQHELDCLLWKLQSAALF